MRRFRYALDPICLGACLLYGLNRWILKSYLASPFLHGQFDDLLLIPAALPVVLGLQRFLGLRTHDEYPKAGEILLHLVLWSILFEVIGPHLLPVIGDPRDVIAYALGGAVAALAWSRQSRSAIHHRARRRGRVGSAVHGVAVQTLAGDMTCEVTGLPTSR